MPRRPPRASHSRHTLHAAKHGAAVFGLEDAQEDGESIDGGDGGDGGGVDGEDVQPDAKDLRE